MVKIVIIMTIQFKILYKYKMCSKHDYKSDMLHLGLTHPPLGAVIYSFLPIYSWVVPT